MRTFPAVMMGILISFSFFGVLLSLSWDMNLGPFAEIKYQKGGPSSFIMGHLCPGLVSTLNSYVEALCLSAMAWEWGSFEREFGLD